MIILYIAIAGGIGAVSRFIADGLVRTLFGRAFPWGTVIINVTGSFLLGIVTGVAAHGHPLDLTLIVGTGFCGGFTSFSTASFETVRLIEERRFTAALLQLLLNGGLSILAAVIGISLAL